MRELTIGANREAVDWIGMILSQHSDTLPFQITNPMRSQGDADSTDPMADWEVVIRIQVAHDDRTDARVAQLIAALDGLRRAGLIGQPVLSTGTQQQSPDVTPDDEAHRIGNRFLLSSSDGVVAQDNRIVLRLEPSAAFGTGLHPATRASLLLIERHARHGVDALDLGSGTGILSIALAKMGARVLALDNDPRAVEATRRNVQLNGVESAVSTMQGSLGAGADLGHWMGWESATGTERTEAVAAFDLLIANILARIHMMLVDDYRLALRKTPQAGILITSGYETDREEEVDEALTDAGFIQIDRIDLDGFIALAHQRSESDS